VDNSKKVVESNIFGFVVDILVLAFFGVILGAILRILCPFLHSEEINTFFRWCTYTLLLYPWITLIIKHITNPIGLSIGYLKYKDD
jgi:hypothetical protein